ncbi:MAG: hypothetical protein MMC33_007703 [Icmadophila ericetorum]|nr:hypothetical protein [Icmadophila ericetorum]
MSTAESEVNVQGYSCRSPEDYAELVAEYAQQSIGTSIFTGELFEGLARFLSREFDRAQQVKVDVVVHTFPASTGDQDGNQRKATSDLTICSNTSEVDQLRSERSAIVFMRGHQPPECLTRLGAIFNTNPLFFQRHLEYLWPSKPLKLFSSSSLPSASFNTIRLRVVTLGERGENKGLKDHSHIQALREKDGTAMAGYLHDVAREYGLQAGNSIVRAFNVHSAQYFSIEQEVTVTVQGVNSQWLAMIWTDVGDDLGNGPGGPWQHDRSPKITRQSPFLPAIQFFPAQAAKGLSGWMIPSSHQSQGPFAQSASLLAKNYGLTLDSGLLATDSFYALTELFQSSANSICQLLNLIESVIDQSTGYNLYKSQEYNLENLSYHLAILNRFENGLRENIFDLENHQSLNWPRSCHDYCGDDAALKNKSKAIATAELLVIDFQKLHSRAVQLSARCQSGMSTCMNSAAIAESKRAISQAQQVEQLTRLAFIYIPLSFTASFFGMNLTTFGTGTLHMSTWFAVSIPLVVVSYGVLAWFSGKWI